MVKGVREKAEYVTEECYKFIDHNEKMVGFYNGNGELIESRPANPDELQRTIFSTPNREVNKTGTDNL